MAGLDAVCVRQLHAMLGEKSIMKQISAIAILSLLLISCGGDDGFDASTTDTTTDDSGGSTSTDTGIRIGSGTGSSFVEGVLDVAATAQLSAGGSTSVTVTLVTSTGAPYTTATDVSFTSDCAAQGLATLTSPVSTGNGAATSTYTAIGCSGTDTITATATVGSDLLAASGTVAVAAADLGSVQFVSASPTTISLKGTGGAGQQETSTVTFKVINESGGPVANALVDFALSTEVGGITLTPASGRTGADGKISTIVQAGSIAVPVRVIATADDEAGIVVSTQSDQLTITTGIPVDGGLDVSVDTFNPEAYDYDGVTVTATANVMDRFHNPVPNGTVVNFRTEAGRIVGSCTTTDGSCDATWTSQSQQLAGGDATGVSTILAYAIGEEQFDDENGNGRYDDGDTSALAYDREEVFVDYNYDGLRDDGTPNAAEPYIDFDGDGQYDTSGDGEFNGVLCERTLAAACSDTASIIVSDTIRIVMSTSGAVINFSVGSLNVQDGAANQQVTITVEDENTNIMPAGTTITITVPGGVEVSGSTSITVPNTPSLVGTSFTLGFADADSTAVAASRGAGYVEVKVTTPGGTETVDSIPITY